MRRQAQSLLHKLRSAMALSPTSGPRLQLALPPRELATSGVRPRGAPATRGTRHAAAGRAGCCTRAEAQAGGSFAAPHTDASSHLSRGQPLALRGRRQSSARPQSSLAAVSTPAAESAPADAPVDAAPPDVRVVDNLADAEDVVRRLLALEDTGYPVYHAVDTEVSEIDVTKETPVGHGRITCFSVYCGPEMDFSDSKAKQGNGKQSRLWVDVLKGGREVLHAFKPYLESETVLKVWHNYAFDRHVFENEGVRPRGFGGDTIHMARLWNSSRTFKGYSLESLTKDEEVMNDAMDIEGATESLYRAKQSMKELFAKPNVRKDGTDGKLMVLPDVVSLQVSPETRYRWIDYSSLDAQATWLLRESLECKLRNMPVEACRYLSANEHFSVCATMWDFYTQNWLPFGEILVDMERNGMLVDKEQLRVAEASATEHQRTSENVFRSWAIQRCEDARYMNVGSGAQVRQLLYAGLEGSKPGAPLVPLEREFKVPNDEWERWDAAGREGKAPKKQRTITLRGIVSPPLKPTVLTTSGLPSTSADAMRGLVGKPGTALDLLKQWDAAQASGADAKVLAAIGKTARDRLGEVYTAFGGQRAGIEAGAAIDALCDASAVETLLTNFILPLQGSNLRGPEQRVHCSLNINTETGRLSARRPNLQNQPALEKDRYGIRRAFICEPGHSLIVADYGQLELRLLAHMANCKSMLEAFRLGGDFHSRTALGMYSHIREAVDSGRCLLEWDGPEGTTPPAPLLKDMFAAERRKAKILNFSIAYGKTKHGLSRDWGVSLEEAGQTVEAWYSDRPEVKAWQQEQHKLVLKTGRVCTLLGRQRHLPDALSTSNSSKAHALRAAINTPIQGGAADIAMLAMLELSRNKKLKDMGWKLLMQVHDEMILEGDSSTADEALAEVDRVMRNPFGGKNLLLCELDVSASHAKDWYTAK